MVESDKMGRKKGREEREQPTKRENAVALPQTEHVIGAPDPEERDVLYKSGKRADDKGEPTGRDTTY